MNCYDFQILFFSISFFYLGFWQKVDTYQEQPDVHFQHQLLINLETEKIDGVIGWSTFDNYNRLLQDNVRVPVVKV